MSPLLKDTFYTITTILVDDSTIKATICINASHEVFKGHFPQMPVVPGVCQVQIIKELLEQATGKTTMMVSGDNIKFTGMILPDTHPNITVEINFAKNEDSYTANAKLFFEETVFTKYKGKFKILN